MNSSAPRYDLAGNRRTRSWSTRLWILSGLLGLLTAVHLVAVIHDDRTWRSSLRATAQATAEQHAERINERLQLFAMETFAPVYRFDSRLAGNAKATATLNQLIATQLANEQCHCKTTLPVAEFFRIEFRAGEGPNARPVVYRQKSGGAFSATTRVVDSALLAIAKADVDRADVRNVQAVRLTFDPAAQGFAIATSVQRDSISSSNIVYGFVAQTHPLMQTLLSASILQLASGDSLHSRTPDTLSLQIGANDSSPLYGKLGDDRPYRGRVMMHGPMDGLGVSVALSSSQARMGIARPPTDRLWALGLLSIGTVLVILIAISSQRRETFLARARSDFIAGTSHDFRMPLAQILLASETLNLRPEVSSAERAGLSKSIVRETHRLIAMVENLLLFSRSGAVEIKPSLQPHNVSQIFEDVREATSLALEDARQSIVLDVDSEVRVLADRQLLRQALVNLVDNAMKYGATAQTITLGAHPHSRDLVRILVDDRGPGIPESQRTRIFEPYERLSRDQTSERAGSGLGLAVVAQIASSLRGRVWVETAPGGGARFVIELSTAES